MKIESSWKLDYFEQTIFFDQSQIIHVIRPSIEDTYQEKVIAKIIETLSLENEEKRTWNGITRIQTDDVVFSYGSLSSLIITGMGFTKKGIYKKLQQIQMLLKETNVQTNTRRIDFKKDGNFKIEEPLQSLKTKDYWIINQREGFIRTGLTKKGTSESFNEKYSSSTLEITCYSKKEELASLKKKIKQGNVTRTKYYQRKIDEIEKIVKRGYKNRLEIRSRSRVLNGEIAKLIATGVGYRNLQKIVNGLLYEKTKIRHLKTKKECVKYKIFFKNQK